MSYFPSGGLDWDLGGLIESNVGESVPLVVGSKSSTPRVHCRSLLARRDHHARGRPCSRGDRSGIARG